MENYTYEYGNNLYINLTNTCTNSCVFCVKNYTDSMSDKSLILSKDPTGDKVIEQLKNYNLSAYENVVFCGFGEPTMNLDALIKTAKYLKTKNATIKLNTNGHGNIINKKDITDELKGLIDIISISLNECDKTSYNKVSKSIYGEKAYDAVIDFTKACASKIPNIVLTVVDIIPKEHIEKCRQIAKDLEVDFRLRHFSKYNG